MPFVRYARDRRGYETLYVMHAFETRPRVLYACRTVPYAKVGRTTLDESVQRRLETAYPSLHFDWPRLLKEAAQSAPRPERTEQRQERKRGGRKAGKPNRVPQVPPVPSAPQVRQVRVQEAVVEAASEEPAPQLVDEVETPEPLEPITELIEWSGAEPEPEPVEPEPVLPEPVEPNEPAEPVNLVIPPLSIDPSWPAVNVVGSERTLILRGRFIELASKILSRVSDADRRQRLFREAARLNPEGWRTEEDARAGLDAFEACYSRVSEQLRQQPPV